jgi:hypothetical protein
LTADVQHHGGMTPQQQLKRRLVALIYEAAKQLGIADAAGCRAQHLPQVFQDRMMSRISHRMLAVEGISL